jgi:hypothetical protein
MNRFGRWRRAWLISAVALAMRATAGAGSSIPAARPAHPDRAGLAASGRASAQD